VLGFGKERKEGALEKVKSGGGLTKNDGNRMGGIGSVTVHQVNSINKIRRGTGSGEKKKPCTYEKGEEGSRYPP